MLTSAETIVFNTSLVIIIYVLSTKTKSLREKRFLPFAIIAVLPCT